MGGGPSVNQPFVAVARVDYRDGTSCPSAADQAFCPPKGYVEPRRRDAGLAVQRRLEVSVGRGKYGPEVRVRFRAPVAITQARDLYLLEGRFPDSRVKRCRRVIMFVPTDRNVARGERVRLTGLVGGALYGPPRRARAADRHLPRQQRQGPGGDRRPVHPHHPLLAS